MLIPMPTLSVEFVRYTYGAVLVHCAFAGIINGETRHTKNKALRVIRIVFICTLFSCFAYSVLSLLKNDQLFGFRFWQI